MFDSTFHRRVALALALVALALSGASAGVAVGEPVSASDVAVDASPVEHDRSIAPSDVATNMNVSANIVRDGNHLERLSAEGQNVTIRTDADAGTKLSVILRENGNFVDAYDVTVSADGIAIASLDLRAMEPGTNFSVTVRRDGAKLARAPGVVTEISAGFVHEGDRPVLRTAQNQTLRVETNAEPGRELTIMIQGDQFVRTTPAVVGKNGNATATFDLSDVKSGTEITVRASPGDAEIDGLLVNESATVHRDAAFPVAEPGSNYTIRGHVGDPTVTKLDVRSSPEGATHSGPQTVMVGEDGTFVATFDLSSVDAGTEVEVSVGGVPRGVNAVVVTEESRQPTAYVFVESPLELSLRHPGDRVLVHPAPDQTVRGTTNLRPGTEVVLTAENGAMNVPSDFSLSETATVGEDGTFAATMNFSGATPGANFTVAVERQGAPTLAEVDGRVVNESVEIPTATAEETTRPTTVNESGFPFTTSATTTQTPTPDDGSDGHADGFIDVPGFGVPVALVSLALAVALVRRRG